MNLRGFAGDISEKLNNSKIFLGILMVINILGSRFIIDDISLTFETFLKKPLFRIIFFFCSLFIVVKDIKLSIILTVLSVIIYKNVILEKFDQNDKKYIYI